MVGAATPLVAMTKGDDGEEASVRAAEHDRGCGTRWPAAAAAAAAAEKSRRQSMRSPRSRRVVLNLEKIDTGDGDNGLILLVGHPLMAKGVVVSAVWADYIDIQHLQSEAVAARPIRGAARRAFGGRWIWSFVECE